MLQHWMEVMLLMFVVFIVSSIVAYLLSYSISENLVKQAIETSFEKVNKGQVPPVQLLQTLQTLEQVPINRHISLTAIIQSISDITLVQNIFGYDDDNVLYTEAVFKLNKNSDEQQFINSVRNEVKSISWTNYQFYETNPSLNNYVQSFKIMQSMTQKILIATIVSSLVILTIILFFNINSRMKETGILLSIGKSKGNILAQYFIENAIIATTAFLGSAFVGGYVGQIIGNQLIKQVAKSIQHQVQDALGGFLLGADSDSDLLMQTIKHVKVTLQGIDIAYLFIIGMGCILIALLVSGIKPLL